MWKLTFRFLISGAYSVKLESRGGPPPPRWDGGVGGHMEATGRPTFWVPRFWICFRLKYFFVSGWIFEMRYPIFHPQILFWVSHIWSSRFQSYEFFNSFWVHLYFEFQISIFQPTPTYSINYLNSSSSLSLWHHFRCPQKKCRATTAPQILVASLGAPSTPQVVLKLPRGHELSEYELSLEIGQREKGFL